MKLLIDGDAIIYKVGFASEGTRYICPDGHEERYIKDAKAYCKDNELDSGKLVKTHIPDPIENALHSAKLMVNGILKEADTDDYVIYLKNDSEPGFRHILDENYKANRKDASPPYHAANIREYLENKYNTEESAPGLEVDDMLGIYQTEDTCIVSHDKDLLMVEGEHIHIEYDSTLTRKYISSLQGMKAFYGQVLTGDTVDNIIGIRGIGKKTAEKMLEGTTERSEMEDIVEAAYEKAGLSPQHLELNKKLLWICRDENDLDRRTGDLVDEST